MKRVEHCTQIHINPMNTFETKQEEMARECYEMKIKWNKTKRMRTFVDFVWELMNGPMKLPHGLRLSTLCIMYTHAYTQRQQQNDNQTTTSHFCSIFLNSDFPFSLDYLAAWPLSYMALLPIKAPFVHRTIPRLHPQRQAIHPFSLYTCLTLSIYFPRLLCRFQHFFSGIVKSNVPFLLCSFYPVETMALPMLGNPNYYLRAN